MAGVTAARDVTGLVVVSVIEKISQDSTAVEDEIQWIDKRSFVTLL